jgi:hypothetical protein
LVSTISDQPAGSPPATVSCVAKPAFGDDGVEAAEILERQLDRGTHLVVLGRVPGDRQQPLGTSEFRGLRNIGTKTGANDVVGD